MRQVAGRSDSRETRIEFSVCVEHQFWGRSSVGRALEWHSRGRGFDPLRLHQLTNLMPFYVYILKSEKSGKSCIGHTSDLVKRLVEHNNGKSISTRFGRPWELIYEEEFQTRSEATMRERYFKSVSGRMELKNKGVL